MVERSKAEIPGKYDLNEKWDACLDLGVRRFVYSSFAGAFAGLLLFRSPVTRWASVAFGAGVGIGSAYSECSHKFNGSPPKLTPNIFGTPPSKAGDE
ncbi:MICOS complex subunit Mic10 isoform X1 [Sesamum indicum]|uniref:MICOS complex subunit Mic10 isoform X1 n=1 Tax=Sesamum indicum TaxID=4182 RepID=A0A6I9UDG4_SESIN|nr:MICOS complex subunit Mic10 isoform X1 [Sesamum indicum]